MPLESNESKGWKMYEDKIPALKKALSYILNTLIDLEDSQQRACLFTLFTDGILHCPTGQSEGIDTVVLALLEGKTQLSTELEEIVKLDIALKKNIYFKMAILSKAAHLGQNVHVISEYTRRLQHELGLSNVLGFEEQMGIYYGDPFSNNHNNVLQIFYQLVTPRTLVEWFMEKVQSCKATQLRDQLYSLSSEMVSKTSSQNYQSLIKVTLDRVLQGIRNQKRLALGKAEIDLLSVQKSNVETLKKTNNFHGNVEALQGSKDSQDEHLKHLQERYFSEEQPQVFGSIQNEKTREIQILKGELKADSTFHPISNAVIINYLQKKGITNQKEGWWKPYFTKDPELDSLSELTRVGAMKILTHLNYVIEDENDMEIVNSQ
jgi:hypothetical protein